MLSFLKNHPFAVEAFFDSSLVLTYAVKKEELQAMIPECLELDTFNDKWAFLAVAMVQTKGLRPKGFPKFFGNNFFLIGYRIFVKYYNTAGKRLRGLYILKSETNRKLMEFFGNLFTHYNYTTTDINQEVSNGRLKLKSANSGFEIEIEEKSGEVNLPNNSPFQDWKTARRFSGPLPFTFTYNKATKQVLIIQGVRENWKPEPVEVTKVKSEFIRSLNLQSAVLANAFVIKNIPYYWKKGQIERWKRGEIPTKGY